MYPLDSINIAPPIAASGNLLQFRANIGVELPLSRSHCTCPSDLAHTSSSAVVSAADAALGAHSEVAIHAGRLLEIFCKDSGRYVTGNEAIDTRPIVTAPRAGQMDISLAASSPRAAASSQQYSMASHRCEAAATFRAACFYELIA